LIDFLVEKREGMTSLRNSLFGKESGY